MKFKDLINHLQYSPLKSISMTNNGKGIKEIDFPQIIVLTNRFLDEYYARFSAKFSEIIVRVIEGKTEYVLHSKFAESNNESTEPVRWIVDSVDVPFNDDIGTLYGVTSSCSKEFTLNDSNDVFTVYTPTYNSIQIPKDFAKSGLGISVIYLAVAPKLEVDTAIDLMTVIDLPDFVIEPLVNYVAGNILSDIGNAVNMAKGKELLLKAELGLINLESRGLIQKPSTSRKLFKEDGWV